MQSDTKKSPVIQGSIKKNVVLNTFYEILSIVLPFVTAPYVSRVIGARGVGIYSYTNSYQSFFAMLAALGTVLVDDLERVPQGVILIDNPDVGITPVIELER